MCPNLNTPIIKDFTKSNLKLLSKKGLYPQTHKYAVCKKALKPTLKRLIRDPRSALPEASNKASRSSHLNHSLRPALPEWPKSAFSNPAFDDHMLSPIIGPSSGTRPSLILA